MGRPDGGATTTCPPLIASSTNFRLPAPLGPGPVQHPRLLNTRMLVLRILRLVSGTEAVVMASACRHPRWHMGDIRRPALRAKRVRASRPRHDIGEPVRQNYYVPSPGSLPAYPFASTNVFPTPPHARASPPAYAAGASTTAFRTRGSGRRRRHRREYKHGAVTLPRRHIPLALPVR